MTEETGHVTGTPDKDYNVIWFVEQCLSNVLRLETYVEDAEREGDSELADFFRRAQETSRKGTRMTRTRRSPCPAPWPATRRCRRTPARTAP